MYLLFTDETNLSPDPTVKFFAYGGLIIKADSLPALNAAIAQIRKDAGYQPGDVLKFHTNARPAHVTIADAATAKERVIQACVDLECRFIAYAILHSIARNTPQKDLIAWGANHVIGKFNAFLTQENDYGICALDRLADTKEYRYLTEKFCHGLDIKGEKQIKLERINLFASTCINASHASSAMDIVLGAFRYCINEPKNVVLAAKMMKQVMRLIWHVREGDTIHALERGLIFRPMDIKVAMYKQEYSDLLAHINLLIDDGPATPAPTAAPGGGAGE